MIAMPDPETMTADERQLEVAGILAGGLLRRVLAARTAMCPAGQIVTEVPEKRLDAPAESRLSVAQRPGGYRPDLLASEGVVDPLSLFLSLKDEQDERVQAALEEMIGRIPW